MSQSHEHDHHHEDDNPYYLDQMCLVSLSAAFGGACLSLYFWRTDILKAMLADQFFPYVLGSGVVLIILAGLRGVALWIQVGRESAAASPLREQGGGTRQRRGGGSPSLPGSDHFMCRS